MKKLILIIVVIIFLVGFFYYMTNSEKASNPTKFSSLQSDSSKVTPSNPFVWSATNTERDHEGSSDFISTSDLQLSTFNKNFRINDYIDKKIYGCQYVEDNYRDSILIQYDNSYSSDFFGNFISYYLCPSIGGFDLFVVEKVEKKYVVKYYSYTDGLPPFTKSNPVILFDFVE